jgi:hypothetical protein
MPIDWAHGYFVSTVGADEATIRSYVTRQEQTDRQIDQIQKYVTERQVCVGGQRNAFSGARLRPPARNS